MRSETLPTRRTLLAALSVAAVLGPGALALYTTVPSSVNGCFRTELRAESKATLGSGFEDEGMGAQTPAVGASPPALAALAPGVAKP